MPEVLVIDQEQLNAAVAAALEPFHAEILDLAGVAIVLRIKLPTARRFIKRTKLRALAIRGDDGASLYRRRDVTAAVDNYPFRSTRKRAAS